MGQQVNIICKQNIKHRKINYNKIIKYIVLDPKPSDLTIIRSKVRTDYRCKDIR